ncbi:MAG: tape measure protein, partial [Hyphomicrobium sp.]
MAGELERLLIRIEADTALLRKELDAADKRVGAFGDAVDKNLARTERRFSSFSAASSRILGGLAVGYLVRETAQLGDAYTNMTNRLKFVTSSSDELASVQARLFQIAQTTRQSLPEVTELYSRMAFALRDAGASSSQVLQFTENLNKALALSGAAGAEASGALVQLSQGLASGTLRGQELNSILEQTPYLAALIAKQMGVTTGELRKLGEQGKITGTEVFNAITGASDELDRKFSQTVPTVSQGFVTIGNSLLNFVGHVNETSEAGKGLANILQQIAGA